MTPLLLGETSLGLGHFSIKKACHLLAWGTLGALLFYSQPLTAQQLTFPSTISVETIEISGTQTVSADAVRGALTFAVGRPLESRQVSEAIQAIYALGYFQDVQITQPSPGHIVVLVVEKPTVEDVLYEGFSAISDSDVSDKILTKQYTIVSEKSLAQDVKTITQAYVDAGYYLAQISYRLQEVRPGVVDVVFHATEGDPVAVRSVNFVGNVYFSEDELFTYMTIKPYDWLSMFTSSGVFRDEFLAADQQNITYIYRDNGYADAVVTTPMAHLSPNRQDIDVVYSIEPGEQFTIDQVVITGDLLEEEPDILEKLILTRGKMYRISNFNTDMNTLKALYGDQGYAFVYIYPTFEIDRDKKTYSINYNITKGQKAYFGNITIEGNVKTRDNVIRRQMKVSENQRYTTTGVRRSRMSIERLAFFETVSVVEELKPEIGRVDLKVMVKEKSTGSLSASLGASPNSNGGSGVTFFAQGQYQERNFLGRGYGTSVNLQLSPSPEDDSDLNYTVGANFTNPSINNGPWGFGVNAKYSYQVQNVSTSTDVEDTYLTQKSSSLGVTVGREIFIENLRLSFGYTLGQVDTDPEFSLTAPFYASGRTEKGSLTLTYDNTDSYVTPTEGYHLSASNSIAFKGVFGDYEFGKVSGNASLYIPVNFTETYRTNFRLAFIPQYVYQLRVNEAVPYWERLYLGSAYYMKGYSNTGEVISPIVPVTISPVTGQTVDFIVGGNQSYYSVLEYYLPLIPEAGLRFVTFGEAGMVLDDRESFSADKIKYDVGFGIRWNTPIAPFRFEWAFPLEDGQLGPAHFIFAIGYDSFDMM